MIKKYTFFGGGNIYMIDLWFVRIGIKARKIYMVQFRGHNAIEVK